MRRRKDFDKRRAFREICVEMREELA